MAGKGAPQMMAMGSASVGTPLSVGPHGPRPYPPSAMQGDWDDAEMVIELTRTVTLLLLEHEKVDGRAAQTLMDASPAQQLQVWRRGTLQGSKNPSSALLG